MTSKPLTNLLRSRQRFGLASLVAALAFLGFVIARIAINHASPARPDVAAVPEPLLPPAPNLIWPSERLDDGRWHPVENARVRPNVGVAPNGKMTADLLQENEESGLHRIETDSAGVQPIEPYVFSIFAKPAGRSVLMVEIRDTRSLHYGVATFDLASLKMRRVSGNVVNAGIRRDAGGWLRCWAVSSFGDRGAVMTLTLVTNAGVVAYPGDGKAGILLWGAQLSPGSRLSAYTPTDTQATPGEAATERRSP